MAVLAYIGFTTLLLRLGHYRWVGHADALSILNGKIVDIFTNIVTVRIFSRGKYEMQYLGKYQDI